MDTVEEYVVIVPWNSSENSVYYFVSLEEAKLYAESLAKDTVAKMYYEQVAYGVLNRIKNS